MSFSNRVQFRQIDDKYEGVGDRGGANGEGGKTHKVGQAGSIKSLSLYERVFRWRVSVKGHSVGNKHAKNRSFIKDVNQDTRNVRGLLITVLKFGVKFGDANNKNW